MPTPPDNKVKSYSNFAAHCSVTAKAQGKFTRHQNVERYRRLLKTATDEERPSYLGRRDEYLIVDRGKLAGTGAHSYRVGDG
jgi:hypothetical protein